MMRRVIAGIFLALLAAAPSPAAEPQRELARKQLEFGVTVARRGLWKEAIYRWERAAELDPTYGAAFNNLAIAYEHEGQLDLAKNAYERAIELDPKNTYIKTNYDYFKEINERAKGRDAR